MTTPPAPDLDERPRWTASQWVMATVVGIGVCTVLVVLFLAMTSVRALEHQLQTGGDQYERFLTVVRESGRLEVELLRTDDVRAPAIDTQLALLDRHVAVLSTLADVPGMADRTVADIERVLAVHGSLRGRLSDASPAVAADLASELERTAKSAADRAETARRQTLLDQVAATQEITGRTIPVLVGMIVINASLLLSLRRRSRRSYEEAHAVAVAYAHDLETSNEELREANEAKRRFVSMISHELRTPLTVIRGFAETLARHGEELSSEQRDQLAGSIVQQSLRQQRMVEDLLVLSRHGDAPPPTSPMTLRVRSLVTRVVDQLASTDTPIDHVEVLRGPDCTLWADPHHTEQVLRSLLSNAEKYGGETVEVSWAATTEEIVIVVEDDGPGVPTDFVADLFSPFAQGDEGDQRLSRGVGLGLTIAKLLVTANGGDIRYAPRAEGGARFEVRLPRATAADIAPDAFRAARRPDPPEELRRPPADILPTLT